jgi:nitrite reductase (NADH) small subunit
MTQSDGNSPENEGTWVPLFPAAGKGGAIRGDQIPSGAGLECLAGDAIVAVFAVDGTYYGLDGICLHAGGPLAEGYVNGCVVTCPWHGWQYDLRTGENCLNARIRTRSFPIRVETDGSLSARIDAPQ